MTKSAPTKGRKAPAIELEPDAWPRFERFISSIAKAGPQHRATAKPKADRTKSPKQKKKAPPKRD